IAPDFEASCARGFVYRPLQLQSLAYFSGELAHIDPIPPRIEEADFDLEEEIRLVKNLLYDNSSPRLPKELNAEIANTIVESLSPSPILIEDKLLSNDTLPLPETKSFHFDHHDDPSFPRPPPEPPDVEIFSNFEPDSGVLTAKVVKDISEHYILMPKVLPSQPALCPNIDTLLSFSSENEDKVFKPGILSYLLVSHRDKITYDFFENLMMMYGGDIPLLDVPYLHFYPPWPSSSMEDRVRLKTRIAPDFEASCARGFVYRPLQLQSLAYVNLIS
nr:hypothetical protein [Tanacetum cinerariifolium]